MLILNYSFDDAGSHVRRDWSLKRAKYNAHEQIPKCSLTKKQYFMSHNPFGFWYYAMCFGTF